MKPIESVIASIADLQTIHDRCLVVTGRILNSDYPWERTQDNDDIAWLRVRLSDAVLACQVALNMVGAPPPVTLLSTGDS